jgi:hypothetical protein
VIFDDRKTAVQNAKTANTNYKHLRHNPRTQRLTTMNYLAKAERIKTFARTNIRFVEIYGYHWIDSPNFGTPKELEEGLTWDEIFHEEVKKEWANANTHTH